MKTCRVSRQVFIGLATAGAEQALPQQPFDLDTSFRTTINAQHVSSIAPLGNGDFLLAGQIRFADDPQVGPFRPLARIDAQGNRVNWFSATYGAGRITPWNDRFYVGPGMVRRMFDDGSIDQTYIHANFSPYFTSFQAGDYHAFSDGRVVLCGRHNLSDTIRGYVGPHCLCWFSNEGYLDTTRVHRKCSGVLYHIKALPDGKFMGSGTTATYDEQPASNILRLNADGSLDPTFQANVTWGSAYDFLPSSDGRIYAAGLFTIPGAEDTLQLVRFLADGSLDPAFNNSLFFEPGELTAPVGAFPFFIHQLDEGRIIVTGGFQYVNGEIRKGICAVDTMGNLVTDLFADCGGGSYLDQFVVRGSIAGIIPTADGFYIWGSHHGFNDGTTNDTTQRMVSRLYGLDVGIHEESTGSDALILYPSPGRGSLNIKLPKGTGRMVVTIRNAQGALVAQRATHVQELAMATDAWPAGLYLVEVRDEAHRRVVARWVKE